MPCRDKCRFRCFAISAAHRQQCREQMRKAYSSNGQLGRLVFLNTIVDITPLNEEWASKTGWSGRAFQKSSTDVSCKWCKCKTLACQGKPHRFSNCPDSERAKVVFEQRREQLCKRRGSMLFFLPPDSSAGPRIQVCRAAFCNVFGLRYRSKLLARLRSKDQRLVLPALMSRGRQAGYNEETAKMVKEHIKRYPRSTGHYSIKAQYYARYFTDSTLTAVKMWKDFCRLNDRGFYNAAVRVSYWPSYDDHNSYKKKPKVSMPKPLLTYQSLLNYLKLYDVSFKKLQADVCDECDRLQAVIDDGNSNEAEVEFAQKALEIHKVKADECYARRADHIKSAKEDFPGKAAISADTKLASLDKTDCQVQDAWGNLRTPRLPNGQAYYLRILPVWVYDFYSAASQTHFLYSWNETIGHKGVDNVISAEYHHHQHHRTGVKCLKKWMDGCYGQANNYTVVKEQAKLW